MQQPAMQPRMREKHSERRPSEPPSDPGDKHALCCAACGDSPTRAVEHWRFSPHVLSDPLTTSSLSLCVQGRATACTSQITLSVAAVLSVPDVAGYEDSSQFMLWSLQAGAWMSSTIVRGHVWL